MLVEVYADVLFAVNFGMNTLVFALSLVICRKPFRVWRVLAGAGVSALLYVVLFFSPLAWILGAVSAPFILAAGLVVAAKYWSIKDFGLVMVMAYAAAFAAAGAVAAISQAFAADAIASAVGLAVANTGVWHVPAAAVLVFVVLKVVQRRLAGRIVNRQEFIELRVSLGGRECHVNALVDSGNSLSEPISGKPVIVIELDAIEGIFPDEFAMAMRAGHDAQSLLMSASEEFQLRLRLIPYSSIGRQNGMIIGVRPDKVEIINNTNERQSCHEVIFGIVNFGLDANGGYHALANPAIFV